MKSLFWPDVNHQIDQLESLINNDHGLCRDAVQYAPPTRSGIYGWASFLVAHRLHEQAATMFVRELNPRKVGHCLKSEWLDPLKDIAIDCKDDKRAVGLETGYKWWNAIFQSPWADYEDMLQVVENGFNDKEYGILEPEKEGADIHPLLPLALADAAQMMLGAIRRENLEKLPGERGDRGIYKRDTTPFYIREIIKTAYLDYAGANLSFDLLNEKIREAGSFLILWSRAFHVLRLFRVPVYKVKRNVTKDRSDGSSVIGVYEEKVLVGYEYELEKSSAALMGRLFDGDSGLAKAFVDIAQVLKDIRDWRLQAFITTSGYRPFVVANGDITDATKGQWRKELFGVDW